MVKFIADVGSNFNESLETAVKYVEECAKIGVDIVKFQCWKAEDLFWKGHPAYGEVSAHRWGLPLEWHKIVKEKADELGVTFSTTPTQPYQIEYLEKIGLQVYKVASGDITFFPLLKEINETGKTVILSTGMATLQEIEEALELLGKCKEVILLHCVSLYPPRYEEVNLKAIENLKRYFPNCKIGLSDHTPDDVTAIASVALGVSYIEKHITFSRDIRTPDAFFSLTVEEFSQMMERVKRAEKAVGSGVKKPTFREKLERFWARRGIYLKEDVEEGGEITLEKLCFLRPAKGIPAELVDLVLGKRLKRPKKGQAAIFFEDV